MKKLACVVMVLVMALTLGACGGTTEPTEPTAPPVAPPVTPPTQPVPAAPARTYALPGGSVFPEGVAYDPTRNIFFTGSTNDGTIFRGDLGSGEVKVFSAGGSDGRTAAIGMKVDAKTRRLWVCGGGTGQVFVYNADTGALIRKYSTPAAADTFLNDVAIAPNGDAYITDSRRPVLFRIGGAAAEPGELESWLDLTGTIIQYTSGATNLNGIVITQAGAYMIVVHSSAQKLYRISLTGREVWEINLGGVAQGGDGMVLDGNTLYVLARTQTSDGIVRIQLTPTYASGTIKDTFRDESFAFPTTIAKVDGRMLVVNSQFNARSAGQEPKLPFTVSDIPIPP